MPSQPQLRDFAPRAYVIAYKEDTDTLCVTLTRQGFDCQLLRQVHNPEYKGYSPSYLCLLNHTRAWQDIVDRQQTAVIFEADFVPVQRMGNLPVPCDLKPDEAGTALEPVARFGMAWLYTCAPQVYSVSAANKAIGYSTSMVAYLLSPKAAEILLAHAESIRQDPGPKQYSTWDSAIETKLRASGLESYVPFRNYGEHGGKPNAEHRLANLSSEHRADVLYGPLAFQPPYCEGASLPWLKVFLTRAIGRAKGLGRLVLNRYVRGKVLRGSSTPGRILRFALLRHLTLRL